MIHAPRPAVSSSYVHQSWSYPVFSSVRQGVSIPWWTNTEDGF